MYNKIKIIFFILTTIWSTITLAASFEATVNTTHLSLNQSIKLTLLLSDTTAKEQPDLDGLQEYFITRGVQKFKNFSSINGKVTKEEGWLVTLQPKMAGELIIPVIPLKTDKGMLYTQAINIYVDTRNTQTDLPVTIEGKVNKTEVFVQEPFVYTLIICREGVIAESQLSKLEIADCMVEQIGEQKQKQKIVNGKQVETTEIQYLITPLKPGNITIPPIAFQGEIIIPEAQTSKQLDPFGNIHIFGNFGAVPDYEPFAVQTKAQEIKVNPPIATVNPWLPLYSLEMKESWDNLVNIKVSEPIIREITISAVGAAGEQLPGLKTFHEIEGIKIYAEEPKFSCNIQANTNKLLGTKSEKYTLIPTKAGTITIPAITINWWDLAKGDAKNNPATRKNY